MISLTTKSARLKCSSNSSPGHAQNPDRQITIIGPIEWLGLRRDAVGDLMDDLRWQNAERVKLEDDPVTVQRCAGHCTDFNG